MAQLFISYSRVDLPFVRRLDERIQTAFPDLRIWRDNAPNGLIGGDNWWEAILGAIAESDVFVYVLSNESVQSLYCQAEFTEARRLQKRIVTIQARDRTELTDDLDDIQFIDMKNGPDDPEALPRLFAAITRQLELAKKPRRPQWKKATKKPHKEAPPTRPDNAPEVETPPLARPSAEAEELRLARSGVRWQIIGVVVAVIATIISLVGIALVVIQLTGGGTPTAVVQASIAPATTQAPLMPTNAPKDPPTLSSFDQLQTAQMQLTDSATMQAAADLTATRETILSANATGTTQQIAATEAAARATLLALSWTPSPTPSLTPTPTSTPDPQAALAAARAFSGSNADWQALYPDGFVAEFQNDGVPMALVPAGCFMMGSNDDRNDEQPVHEECFESPFWIDLTEVTQTDFERLEGVKANANQFEFDGAERPVEQITWFEARDFCALRGARLPTEREWEYAVRGPAATVYPWGNDWNPYNTVWNRSSSQGTANAGSIPEGRSWVGAYDLSGNVWEWVSSLYLLYDSPEDREADTGTRTDVQRVLRGGSWDGGSTSFFRASGRNGLNPGFVSSSFGFRCARSYNAES